MVIGFYSLKKKLTSYRHAQTWYKYDCYTCSLMAARPAVAKEKICREKAELADALTAAIHDVFELQNQQLASLAEGRSGLDRFELAIKRARQKRDRAKQLYILHVRAHGC